MGIGGARTKQTARLSTVGAVSRQVETVALGVDELNAENMKLKDENRALLDANDELEDTNADLQLDNEDLRSEQKRLKSEVETLRALDHANKDIIDGYLMELVKLRKLIKQKDEEIEFYVESLVEAMDVDMSGL
jgi:chromosome segregation ATPase